MVFSLTKWQLVEAEMAMDISQGLADVSSFA